ncbi:MAG TPA: hypothetical protein VGC92_13785 [Phenylobacterium sp.]|jgi:hypothetical protein
MGRTRDKAERLAAVGAQLKAMFRSLEQRPAPQALRDVVDQLDAPPAPPPRRAGREA